MHVMIMLSVPLIPVIHLVRIVNSPLLAVMTTICVLMTIVWMATLWTRSNMCDDYNDAVSCHTGSACVTVESEDVL